MNTVDQRILIPAPPEVVWEYLSNLENNPQWQANCRAVAFVSTKRRGQGTRWRHTNNRGRDVLIEITAWYERAGYAYRIVDGSPYSHNSGSIRLQEIAEGTIVQWTFEYEISGLFSGFRNAISVRRGIENDIIESLENLWRQASKLKNTDSYTAKSLMREAPDVQSRANYQPRHPSKMKQRADEIIESDTDVSLQVKQEAASQTTQAEETIPEQSLAEKQITTNTLEQITPPETPEPEPDFLSELDHSREMQPVVIQQSEEDNEQWMRPAEFVEEQDSATQPDSITTNVEPEDTQPYQLERLPDDDVDSSTMSVFELFGLPKPSETQQMRAIAEQAASESISTPQHQQTVKTVDVTDAPVQSNSVNQTKFGGGRVGMRVILRRRLIKIKRP